MNCILAVRLQMKVKFCGRGFAVALVQGLLQVMDKESKGFAYLRQKFPKVSEAKRKKEFLFVHELKQLFEDHSYSAK
jgi:hypothetical protein